MRKRILRLFLTLFILISFPAFASGERDSLSHSDRQVLNQVADSIARSHNWKTLLKERKLDPKDTTVVYPKFLGFCVKVYNWADRVFNSYDTTYVVGTGKKWKARILSDNWVDSYYLNPGRKMPMRMMSDVYSNLGAYIQFMAVSLGYSFDLGRFFGQTPSTHNKLEFNFNCARFNVEGHFWESYGGTYIRTFGGYNNGHLIKEFSREPVSALWPPRHIISSTTVNSPWARLITSLKFRRKAQDRRLSVSISVMSTS